MRLRGRRDLGHSRIVAELRQLGFSVLDLASLGRSVPDLLVARAGTERLVEVKSGKKIHRHASALSAGQKSFAENWRGPPVIVALTTEDVLKEFNHETSPSGRGARTGAPGDLLP